MILICLRCEEYDLWFNKCKAGNRTENIKIHHIDFEI